jgi:hypothetical protein
MFAARHDESANSSSTRQTPSGWSPSGAMSSVTSSWAIPLEAARAGGLIGVDTNADHLAAYHLDPHGNPVGNPQRFFYQLTGTAGHRDAQVRHALTRLLHWATREGVSAIAVEDLDFGDGKTREKAISRPELSPMAVV